MTLTIESPLAFCEKGRRARNQDWLSPPSGRASKTDRLFVLCDGMGGPPCGGTASRLCGSIIAEKLSREPAAGPIRVDRAVKAAQAGLARYSERHPACRGLGTTMVLLQIGETAVFGAWCGDSRLYHCREGRILYRSRDHSHVQRLVDSGVIDDTAARHHPLKGIITRAITDAQAPAAECHHFRDVRAGDRFLLCSDGVIEAWEDARLRALLAHSESEHIMRELQNGCARHSSDNYSAYLVTVRRHRVASSG